MATRGMLPGHVDTREQDIEQLRQDVQRLQDALDKARQEAVKQAQGIALLRGQLAPLFRALQMIFDVTDQMAPADSENPAAQYTGFSPQELKVWGSWKQKLGGVASRIIDALLEHGEMSVAQIRVACHCGQQTVYDVTHKMHGLGLINRNGGRYSLKKL